MSNRSRFRLVPLARACALTLAAVLTACGGGGGGGNDSGPPGSIDLSVANRDPVAHAAVAGAMGLGGADQVVASGASAVAPRQLAQSLRAVRERALGIVGPVTEPCAVSGSIVTSLDDRDNNGAMSVGDVMTMQYVQCKDSFEETVDGRTALTLTQVLSNGIRGTMVQDPMTMVRDEGGQRHSNSMSGTMQITYTESSSSVGTLRLVCDGPNVAVVSTPVFADTVTLADGYLQESVFDTVAPPPPGGVLPGRISTTTSGRIASQVAGGDFTVATTDPIVQYTDDAFPRAGSLRITGRKGTLGITAVSATDVRLDLDAESDGNVELSTLQRWDWLI
jgi:hypothetical protein